VPDALSDQERFDRLRLARTERVGPVAFQHLIQRHGSATRALAHLPHVAGVSLAPVAAIEREIAAGEALGAKLLVLGDADFPPLLAALDPPAPLLWALGDTAMLSRDAVAVVGARSASASAQRFARGLASDLGAAGYVVVSGMARGVDGAAHEGALETGTIAVLAGGVDDIYPPEHGVLYRRIAERGCLVSESPVGARAQARDFPRRNRIISGLSLGVVVVEAEIRSGSLITARLAGEQGRDVFAVPGSPLDPRCKGSNDLLRQGAILCEGAEDVLRSISPAARLVRDPAAAWDALPPDVDTDKLRSELRALLSPTPTPRDELVRATGQSAAAVSAALIELALAGEAELLDGALVCRSG
jgi:DNA processing protein